MPCGFLYFCGSHHFIPFYLNLYIFYPQVRDYFEIISSISFNGNFHRFCRREVSTPNLYRVVICKHHFVSIRTIILYHHILRQRIVISVLDEFNLRTTDNILFHQLTGFFIDDSTRKGSVRSVVIIQFT